MLKPLADKVVVRLTKAEEKMSSGILLPANAKAKNGHGEVIAVGPGKRDERGHPMRLSVSVGDKVVFNKECGEPVHADGEDLLILGEDELLAVVA
jgi:chaperonin GroES